MNRFKKFLSLLITFAIVITTLSACSKEDKNNVQKSDSKNIQADQLVKVQALKGPTGMGIVKLIDDQKNKKDKKYDIKISNSIDEISPLIIKGKVDMAAIPSNLASVLYNKTKGKVQVMAINTLGVLYMVDQSGNIKSIPDLRGKTIYLSGKGATPEIVLNSVLKSYNIDPQIDVNIEYKQEHTECLAALEKNKNAVAMLPEPFVSAARLKNKDINVFADMTKEWYVANPDTKNSMITGVMVVRTDFAEKHPDQVKLFMEEYKKSIEYTNTDIEKSAKLIGQNKIVPEAVAKLAIPKSNIKYIDGKEMKDSMKAYLEILNKENKDMIGGKMPGEDFYYTK